MVNSLRFFLMKVNYKDKFFYIYASGRSGLWFVSYMLGKVLTYHAAEIGRILGMLARTMQPNKMDHESDSSAKLTQ